MSHVPVDPGFAARVRDSFARQPFMHHLGARIARLAPGECDLELPHRPELTQQHGYFHAGAVATLADDAGGYAAYSLMAEDSSVLSVEFKLNLLAPARGERLLARATVLRAGRTLSVCRCDVFALAAGQEKLVAACQMTVMQLAQTPDR